MPGDQIINKDQCDKMAEVEKMFGYEMLLSKQVGGLDRFGHGKGPVGVGSILVAL